MTDTNCYTQSELNTMEIRERGYHPTPDLLAAVQEKINSGLTTADAVSEALCRVQSIVALTRDQMINVMIKDDINSIRESLAQHDTKFLDSILRGDSGWIQYSQLTNIQIANEYDGRNKDGELDELFFEIYGDQTIIKPTLYVWNNSRTGEHYGNDTLGKAVGHYHEQGDKTLIFLGMTEMVAMTISGRVDDKDLQNFLEEMDWTVSVEGHVKEEVLLVSAHQEQNAFPVKKIAY